MREKLYRVVLTDDDRAVLYRLTAGGIAPARQLTHARILFKADEGPEGPAWTDVAIADALEIDRSTVARVRHLFVLERHVTVTERRTGVDWAHCIKDLVEVQYPETEKIVLVLDQLNTHTTASLYEAFAPTEAQRLADRLEIHYTPKHGSWLNLPGGHPRRVRSACWCANV